MKQLDHDRVSRLYHILDDEEEGKLYLMMDFCEFGDIAKWNSSKQLFYHRWSPKEVVKFFKQAADGLDYCNSWVIVSAWEVNYASRYQTSKYCC